MSTFDIDMGEEQGDAGWGDSNSSDGWGSAAAAPSDGSSYTGGDFFQSNYDSPNSAADASKGYPAPSSFTPPPQQSFSQPNLGNVYNGNAGGGSTSFEDEEPLLDELGINFSHIKSKTVAVLNPFAKVDPLLMVDADMAGPLIFCLALGVFYMMSGKLHFDYIYGLGGLGCTALFGLLNLMSERGINLYNTISVFGYALLPMTILAGVAVVYPLNGLTGYAMAAIIIAWCSRSAATMYVAALELRDQKLLVMYPCCLLYTCFALITIF